MHAPDHIAEAVRPEFDHEVERRDLPENGGKFHRIFRASGVYEIPLSRLAPDEDQPRHEFDIDDLEKLARSMQQRGQLQPIRVRYDEKADVWRIISGERRYRAALMVNFPTLTCIDATDEMPDDEILEDQLVENCVRADLTPIEQAKAFKTLLDRRNCSYRQLADLLTISHQTISRAIGLLDLPADLQEQVDSGRISPSIGSEVARLDDEDDQRELAAEAVSHKMTREQVKTKVKEKMGKSDSTRARSEYGPHQGLPILPADVLKLAHGVELQLILKPEHTFRQVVEALRSLADTFEPFIDRPEQTEVGSNGEIDVIGSELGQGFY